MFAQTIALILADVSSAKDFPPALLPQSPLEYGIWGAIAVACGWGIRAVWNEIFLKVRDAHIEFLRRTGDTQEQLAKSYAAIVSRVEVLEVKGAHVEQQLDGLHDKVDSIERKVAAPSPD